MAQQLLCSRGAPLETALRPYRPRAAASLAEGEVLVHVAKLLLTSNTQTYALAGDHSLLKYFDHFPAPADAPKDAAFCPCWGVGVVTASRCGGVAAGTRLYGYFTFSPEVVLKPGDVTPSSFVDAAEHRRFAFAAYNTYYTASAPHMRGLDYTSEDFQMANGILFSTGWAMAQAAAIHPARPAALLLTSASSRTAAAAAFAAKFHKLPLQVVGLTSERNRAYVQAMGTYDVVATYDGIAALALQPVAVLDVAGDAAVQQALYRRFAERLVYLGAVGMSHVGGAGRGEPLELCGGARPAPFLVFQGLEAAAKAYGQRESNKMLLDATVAYRAALLPKFQPHRSYGGESAQAVWRDMAAGRCSPEVTYVVSLWPEPRHDPARASKL